MLRIRIVNRALFIVMLFLSVTYQGGQAQEKMELRVGYLPVLSQLPLIVSYENDRMNFVQLKLKVIRYNSFTALEAALRVGAIDVASVPVPIALSMSSDGHEIRIIGMCHSGGSQLVSRTKGGLESVHGQLIGVSGLDSNENLKLSQVLGTINLRHGLEYKTIGVTFTSVINNLKNKKLDAIYLPEPFGTIAEKEKIAFTVKGQEGQLTGTLGTVLVIRSVVLEKNRIGVEEWLKSLVKNCRFIEDDIKNSRARQTAIIQASYFNYSEDIVISSLTGHKGDLRFNAFVPDHKTIKTYMELAARMKILTKSVDLNNLISIDLIRKLSK